MSLIFKSEPPEVVEVVRTSLGRMMSMRAFHTPNLARIVTDIHEDQALTPPIPFQVLPVYHIGLADLAAGQNLDFAFQIGWRYLLKHNDEVVASADVIIDLDKKPIFAQINEGPLVQGTVLAFKAAGVEEDVKKSEYETRFLTVPALYVASLWLVDMTDNRDLAIPIAPTPPYLKPNKAILVGDLLNELQKAAKETLSAQSPDS